MTCEYQWTCLSTLSPTACPGHAGLTFSPRTDLSSLPSFFSKITVKHLLSPALSSTPLQREQEGVKAPVLKGSPVGTLETPQNKTQGTTQLAECKVLCHQRAEKGTGHAGEGCLLSYANTVSFVKDTISPLEKYLHMN